MTQLPEALKPLAAYKQFILWTITADGRKLPIDCRTAKVCDAHDPDAWITADEAVAMSATYGDTYGVGFVFTVNDPFFFVDIDKCLNPDDTTWSPVATDLMARLSGAAVEVSQSGRGLHIFGMGAVPDHACKNVTLGLELYTEGRFVALTGTNAIGSASTDHTATLSALVADYFPPRVQVSGTEWTTEPIPEWTGSTDDTELIAKALASGGAANVFGRGVSFKDLWECNESALEGAYPDEHGVRNYDASSADAALAQHLAFWTGKNCERMLSLMQQSGLVRDKWDREDYLIRTITNAVSMQEAVYSMPPAADTTISDQYGAVKLRGSEAQRAYADNIRAQKMIGCDADLAVTLCKIPTAKFWIENKDLTPEEMGAKIRPIENVESPLNRASNEPHVLSGYQYLGATQQMEYFKGCVYVQDMHRIFTPNGSLLKSEQFNATYGGYSFQLDDGGDKVTRKAWEAFTESQIVRYPKAESMCFRPDLASGELVEREGQVFVNTYIPVALERKQGDVSPFLDHLSRVLPIERDRAILLAYMAACVQHKGIKFQWAPLLQGAEGNGKTLFTRCVAAAVGKRYTHYPKASDLANKFNSWLLNKLFIGVEDIYVPEHKQEVIETLKPMITGGDGLEIQFKGVDQLTKDICANFMLNSNHKDAVRKTRSDRRFAVFYTAQQDEQDIIKDGMGGNYFPKLYMWLREEGYAIVTDYLNTYAIPDELNPATSCHRAPETSSTNEAISSSLGGIEQEIMEAIEEGRPGFAGGWVSSVAVERLLHNIHATRSIPHNKRRDLLKSLGYDWHPVLTNGRTNIAIPLDDNKKPRLFVKADHPSTMLSCVAEVTKMYMEAQGATASIGSVEEVFKK